MDPVRREHLHTVEGPGERFELVMSPGTELDLGRGRPRTAVYWPHWNAHDIGLELVNSAYIVPELGLL